MLDKPKDHIGRDVSWLRARLGDEVFLWLPVLQSILSKSDIKRLFVPSGAIQFYGSLTSISYKCDEFK